MKGLHSDTSASPPLWTSLLKVFLFALLVRMIWFAISLALGDGPFLLYDSDHYLRLADNLVQHGVFSRSAQAPFFPDIARTPFYPLFLALFSGSNFNVNLIAGVQSLLGAFVPVFIFASAVRMGFHRPRLASIVASVDLSLLLFTPVILTDGIFVFLLAALLFALSSPNQVWSALLLAALLTSLLILTRPIAQFLPLLIAAFLLFRGIPKKRVAVYFLVALALPGGWLLRNHSEFGVLTLSSMGSNNLLLYNAAGVEAQATGRPFETVQQEFSRAALQEQDWHGDPEATKKFLQNARAKAWSIFRENPGITLKQAVHSLSFYFFKPPRSYFDQNFGSRSEAQAIDKLGGGSGFSAKVKRYFLQSSLPALSLSLIQIILNLALFFLMLTGAWQLIRSGNQWVWLLLGVLAYFWFLSVFTQTDARFRLPALLPMLLLAAAASWPKRRTKKIT